MRQVCQCVLAEVETLQLLNGPTTLFNSPPPSGAPDGQAAAKAKALELKSKGHGKASPGQSSSTSHVKHECPTRSESPGESKASMGGSGEVVREKTKEKEKGKMVVVQSVNIKNEKVVMASKTKTRMTNRLFEKLQIRRQNKKNLQHLRHVLVEHLEVEHRKVCEPSHSLKGKSSPSIRPFLFW